MFVEKLILSYLKYFRERYGEPLSGDEVHVHDLVRCRKKREFESFFSDALPLLAPSVIIGGLVDIGVKEVIAKENGGGSFRFTSDAEVRREVVVDGRKYTLVGRPDVLTDDYVVEIKFSRIRPSEPMEHHLLQLRLYLFLTGRARGYLVYITPEGFAEFEVSDAPSEQEVANLFKTWTSPRFDWECSYCPFRRICPLAKSEASHSKQ